MDPFQALDFFALDDQYSEDERMVRDAVRSWVGERFLPVIMEHWENGTFPMEMTSELGELGVFGPTVPEEYGGAGLNSVAYGLICQELERGDSGLRSFVSVQGSLVMYPIFAYGSEEQRKEWLPQLASGKAIGCFGLTEPDFGSNPGGMLTTAKRSGNDWILNGRKMWITNGTVSQVAIVWARAEEGIRGFAVPTNLPGFSAPEQKHKWSLRASITSELVLEDVRVPDSMRLPGAEGLKAPLGCLTQARYGIAWGAIGAALACFDEALRYSKDRIVFDKQLAGFQLPQKKLADVATDISLAQLMALRLGRLKDAGKFTPQQVSMAKRNNVDMALRASRTLRDVLGANGISLEYQTGRHMLNLESVNTYEGTHDIHTLAIGHELTGLPAYR
ncbi:MAG: acyl-CoA dehydrogenase family protein [Planctomycetes bacterium]|nr:acyl-CoA dehydrogenase family protein [Planctomycetota bacterium]MCB9911019.1 acyl-CoA dehydrogenase family protein [Planctomycetota bacterium]HRV82545.1 acyl-CoA dehydrogenase family protein [Planctomycetota bacterium]